MRKGPLIVVLVATAASLGGCQLFSSGQTNSLTATQAAPDMSTYFDQRLADGRRHLGSNRLSLAITAYRQASYSPDHKAEAFNGLAISFDRLGRRDLARQYFDTALALSPGDEKIARNLARFDAYSAAIEDAELAVLAARQDASAHSVTGQQEPLSQTGFATGMHGLVRAENGGIALRATDEVAQSVASLRSERPAVVHVGRTETVAAAQSEEQDRYSVRVRLAQAPAQYPVRVKLGGSSSRAKATVVVRRGPPNGRSTSIRISSPNG